MQKLTDSQRELVENNMGIARYMVYKKMRQLLTSYRLELDDALGIANLALCRSALTYDPDKGAAFASYAARLIYQTLLNETTRKQKKRLQHEVSIGSMIGDAKSGRHGSRLNALTTDEDPCFSSLWVKETLASIDPRVRAFFKGEKTQCEIAKATGLSQSYISRLVQSERERLQKELSEDE